MTVPIVKRDGFMTGVKDASRIDSAYAARREAESGRVTGAADGVCLLGLEAAGWAVINTMAAIGRQDQVSKAVNVIVSGLVLLISCFGSQEQ